MLVFWKICVLTEQTIQDLLKNDPENFSFEFPVKINENYVRRLFQEL